MYRLSVRRQSNHQKNRFLQDESFFEVQFLMRQSTYKHLQEKKLLAASTQARLNDNGL